MCCHHESIKKTDVDAVIVESWRTEFFNSSCNERLTRGPWILSRKGSDAQEPR